MRSKTGPLYQALSNPTGTLGHVGSYTYGSGNHRNRVVSAGDRSFTYNANGGITTISGSSSGTIRWSAFNKPVSLEVNGKRSVFGYDTANNRVSQTRQVFNTAPSAWQNESRKTVTTFLTSPRAGIGEILLKLGSPTRFACCPSAGL